MSILTMIPGGLERLLAVSPLDLISYLHGGGWMERLRDEIRSFWVKEDSQGDKCEVLVPSEPTFKDYGVRLYEALSTLEAVEGRPVQTILNDVENFSADVIRVRVSGSDSLRGNIGLEAGVNLLEKARELMMAAACSAIQAKPVHPNRKPEKAVHYIDRVRLGQTEPGSFIVQLISRVPPALEPSGQSELFPTPSVPYERDVTETLARSLFALSEAMPAGATVGNFEPFRNTVSKGVSANLCEALAGLQDEDQKVTVWLNWAKTRRPRFTQKSEFSFSPRSLSILGEAARTFRANAPVEEFYLSGIVVKLAKEPRAQRGEIAVLAVVEGVARRVSIVLEENEYRQAVQAHKDKRAISCLGELVREGRRMRLRYYNGFTVEADE